MRVLILGGTTEARRLAEALAGRDGVEPILSLAGRTERPALQAGTTRIGGFGGVDGLAVYLRRENIDRVIDATHPFAAQMSRHAAEACLRENVPLLVLTRPPWRASVEDFWIEVESNRAAALALGAAPRHIFLTIGRLALADFVCAPHHHYLIRTIDPPGDLAFLPDHRVILARGPFTIDAEMVLLREHRIDVLVTKNSGGASTEAKLDAARALRMPVILVARPAPSGAATTNDLDVAIAFARGHGAPSAERGV